ncbi:MAG: PQQ-binding-like beta-propeller repeat protein [Alphaproteobacteria bacterium]|nr:PQQ-binding-like beta-propeller repeat protein [Alphaproteobacteria bacterium]
MTVMKSRLATLALGVILAGGLASCSTVSRMNPFHGHRSHEDRVARDETNRVPLDTLDDQLKVSEALRGVGFQLGPATAVSNWALPGGNENQDMENVSAAPDFVVAWRRSIGLKSSRKMHVTSPPILAQGRLFVMDAKAEVSAHDAKTGAPIWRRNIETRAFRRGRNLGQMLADLGSGRSGAGSTLAWGGGMAWSDGRLYISSGYREVVCLDGATGKEIWRTTTDTPLHAAPTVANGRVFVEDVNDELFAFDAKDGSQLWTYQALAEPARMLGATSPAVDNDTVVASFASGELVALRAANGEELWNVPLSKVSRTNALSEIRDIVGRPAIHATQVIAVSHSDMMSAVDLRTGVQDWTLPVSAVTSPWVSGDVVYVVDISGRVICISTDSGQIYWITNLNEHLSRKKRVYWTSPLVASDRLILGSSDGRAVALDAKTGKLLKTLKLGSDAMIGPIAADGMVYFVTDKAELVAIR